MNEQVLLHITRFLERLEVRDARFAQAWAMLAELRSFDRQQIILHGGAPMVHFDLVIQGVVRYFYVSYDGKEYNKAFFREGTLVGSLTSVHTGRPSPFSIDLMEDSLLAVTPLNTFLDLRSQYPAIDRMLLGFTARMFTRNEEREAILLRGDAEARYRWVLEREPWLLERVPQYQVAAYLGMNPVSLSRLKRKLR